jgi:hypothetical protein
MEDMQMTLGKVTKMTKAFSTPLTKVDPSPSGSKVARGFIL